MNEVQNLPVPINMVSGLKRKSLSSTTQVVSPVVPAKPVAMVSSTVRGEEEPQQRINVGNNLSQVKRELKSKQVLRALKSQTFQPLPPEEAEESDKLVEFKPVSTGKTEYQKIVDKSVKDAEFKPLSFAEREALYEAQGAKGYSIGESPQSFDEWWEYTEGRGATTNPHLMSKEERDRIFNSHEEPKYIPKKEQKKISNGHRKTSRVGKGRPKKEEQAQGEPRENPIKNAILWATDVNNADAPTLRETGRIAVNQVKEFGKKGIPVLKTAVKEGLYSAKWGVRAVGEVAEEFEKTPMARNTMAQAEADYAHMRSGAMRARGSIGATGLNKKRNLTAGSLVTQKRFGTTTNPTYANASTSTSASNPYGITARYERGNGGRVELHYYYQGNRITHEQVSKVLTPAQIHRLKEAALGQQSAKNNATTTQTTNFGGMHHKTASSLVTRHKDGLGSNQRGNPVVNIRKIASSSGLARKTHSSVV